MKCHFCDGKAVVAIEIASRYYMPACILHEDTVYHDIEMAIRVALNHLLGPEMDDCDTNALSAPDHMFLEHRQVVIDRIVKGIDL